jgi:alanine racemase
VERERVIHTVGRLEDLEALAERGRATDHRPRVVLERMTSMLRHGFTARDLREATRIAAKQGGVVVEGVAMHLPLAKISHLSQVERLMNDVVAAGVAELGGPSSRTVWVSHLTRAELDTLGVKYADFTFRPRIGTGLWLGDRGALSVKATVLDAHAVERGDTYGYRGRTAPRAGTILVVSGGTAHGIGLEAPTGEATLKARAASIARGGLDAAGLVRSPYSVGGKQRLFAEPPHMQASMLFIPAGSAVPEVGDEVDCRVRFTATSFDRIDIS